MKPTNIALSIRQPWAEMILNGSKKTEFRSTSTNKQGQRVYIYTSLGKTEENDWKKLFSKDEGGGTSTRCVSWDCRDWEMRLQTWYVRMEAAEATAFEEIYQAKKSTAVNLVFTALIKRRNFMK